MSFLGSLFGSQQHNALSDAKTPIELVTGAASLVSDPQQVDPLLDRMRGVTAKLEPGQQPTGADEAALFHTYLQLESYLTTKEPLRSFTREELRGRLDVGLRQKIEMYEAKG